MEQLNATVHQNADNARQAQQVVGQRQRGGRQGGG